MTYGEFHCEIDIYSSAVWFKPVLHRSSS